MHKGQGTSTNDTETSNTKDYTKNQRDQWTTGADLGRPSAKEIAGKFYNYIGCYKDHIPRVLNGYELKGSKTMTPKSCVSMCKNRHFKFAGVQFSQECFCGNSLGTTLQPEKECNMACSGDNNQMCGGSMRLSVYHVQ
ncbi:hypothetical protein FSP39_016093 [Pinctada imbricata]|uniref:WSC domain-containing protein n=1 Tax=Pinctada imbricata TaxID=66713 RepID=A0AA89C7S4_PINIB|nr:hypothetical protein FSP39_016093 [Pinctada imbricata]